jgi:hypothetical protein
MPRGSPFYNRSRDFENDVYPPAVEADVFDDYEAAHQEASTRIVGIEQELDAAVKSDDVDAFRVMTQAAYDQLGTKDPRTAYFIKG